MVYEVIMKKFWIETLTILLTLTGCAGVGVVATSNPYTKLSDAMYLLEHEDRALIAERLIWEAIEICKEKQDQLCLAQAYRNYGFFFRSPHIKVWSKAFKEYGFHDKTATYENRYSKSVEYFTKSGNIYTELKKFGLLTNVALNKGFTYDMMGEKELACKAFDESAISNEKHLQADPEAAKNQKEKLSLPDNFETFDEFLDAQRKRVGCI